MRRASLLLALVLLAGIPLGLTSRASASCHLPGRVSFSSWIPKRMPFPKGTYQYRHLRPSHGQYQGLFIVPRTARGFGRFVQNRWPPKGWSLGFGESEPWEVENSFWRGPVWGAYKTSDNSCRSGYSNMYLVVDPDANG